MYRILYLVFVFSLWVTVVVAQVNPKLTVANNFIEATAGESIAVQIQSNTDGRVIMQNAPVGAILDRDLLFSWNVPVDYESANVTVEFYLYDSTHLVDVKSIFIKVTQEHDPPLFSITANHENKDGIFHLHPGTHFHLEVTGYAALDSSAVELNFFFNDDAGQMGIEGATVKHAESQLIFDWIPQLDQIDQKYFSLTINAQDRNDKVSQKVILFILNHQNRPPYFKFPILDDYYIGANEELVINFNTVDPDNDSLVFNLDMPTAVGNPKLNEDGSFYWKLNDDEIRRIRNNFPIEVTVEVSEVEVEKPNKISKTFLIRRSIKNQPPRILNLQNESIFEGLTLQKTIFVQDINDDFDDLSVQIIGAPEGMKWEVKNNTIELLWTPNYDIVGVEMQPKKFDMLLVVQDPHGYVDQKAFTITVNHRENVEITYQTYMDYRQDAVQLIEYLSQMHLELEAREQAIQGYKKMLSVTTMLFAAYTAGGSVYDDGSPASKLVPYVGIAAAIAGGINAFGFNDLPKYGSLKEQVFLLQQKLIYVQAILSEYKIDSENSPNLENKEFRDQLATYEQWMVQDKLNFKNYYKGYKGLNYVKRQTKKQTKMARKLGQQPQGLLFINLQEI